MSSVSSVFRPYGLQTPETGLLTFRPSKKGRGGAPLPISLIRPIRLIRLISPIGPIRLIALYLTPYTLHLTPSLPSSRRPASGVRCPISPICLIGLILQQKMQNLLYKFGTFEKKWYICSRNDSR